MGQDVEWMKVLRIMEDKIGKVYRALDLWRPSAFPSNFCTEEEVAVERKAVPIAPRHRAAPSPCSSTAAKMFSLVFK